MPNDTESPKPSSPEEELARLRARVADLEARVSALEVSKVKLQNTTRGESNRFGLTALNRIGAVTLAVGIIFFFKYAADNHWIGAGGLVLMGMLVGLLLIGFGEWLRSRSEPAFAQGVAGCGFAILYISVYAAVGYYKLIPHGIGFLGMLAVSVCAIGFCFRFASPAIAAVGFIGAWAAPLLLWGHDGDTQTWFHWIYLFLVSVGSVFAALGLFRRAPQKATLLLFPFNAAWALLVSWILLDRQHVAQFVFFALALAGLYFTASALHRSSGVLYRVLYIIGHGCSLIALLRLIGVWSSHNVALEDRESFDSEAGSVLLAVYGLVALAAGIARKSTVNRTLALVLLGVVVGKLYLYDVWLLTRFYRISALVVLGVLLLAASYLYSRVKARANTNL